MDKKIAKVMHEKAGKPRTMREHLVEMKKQGKLKQKGAYK